MLWDAGTALELVLTAVCSSCLDLACRTFDRALTSLPITQHDRVWELYLVRGQQGQWATCRQQGAAGAFAAGKGDQCSQKGQGAAVAQGMGRGMLGDAERERGPCL